MKITCPICSNEFERDEDTKDYMMSDIDLMFSTIIGVTLFVLVGWFLLEALDEWKHGAKDGTLIQAAMVVARQWWFWLSRIF